MRDVGRGMRDERRGMRDVGRGMRDDSSVVIAKRSSIVHRNGDETR